LRDQHPQEVEGVGVPRLNLQKLPVGLLGGLEIAALMLLYGGIE